MSAGTEGRGLEAKLEADFRGTLGGCGDAWLSDSGLQGLRVVALGPTSRRETCLGSGPNQSGRREEEHFLICLKGNEA